MSEIKREEALENNPSEWRDRVQEYFRERGERSLRNSGQAWRECLDRDGCPFSWPSPGRSSHEQASEMNE